MCNSSDTCSTLGDYLSSNSPEDDTRALLEQRLNKYFFWKAHVGKLQTSLRRTPGFNKGERRPSANETATGSGNTGSSSTASTNSPKRNFDEGELSIALQRKDMRRGQAPPNKRRRVRGGGAAGSTAGTVRSSGSSSSGASNLFAAATGANPEALEEDAKTIASMCVLFSCADPRRAIELILLLRSQGRPIRNPGRGRTRRNVRRSIQRA